MQNYDFSCCLNECETWSLTLKEKRRLGLYENRMLRKAFGSNRDEEHVA
jgi:hypothetical protein